MSASRKRIARDEGTDGIIFVLPKHMIDYILEFLPIKDAVRTSILSRKWRYLWSRRTTLVFDKEFFETNFRRKPYSARAYIIVIHNILVLHPEPVLKFIFHIPNLNWDWDEHIDKRLLFLSRNGISELQLENLSTKPYKLPSCVFSCPSLKALRVKNCFFKPLNMGFKFANIGLLHFKNMSFAPNVNGGVLGLPLLKNLVFIDCTAIENFKISAPKLDFSAAVDSDSVKLFPLDKYPNLGRVSKAIEKKVYNQGRDGSFNFGNFQQMFQSVRYLILNGPWLKLSAATTSQRRLSFMFHNLTRLGLLCLRFDDLDQISCALCLLRSSPSLKKLTIGALTFKGTALESISSLLEAPDCLGEMLNLQEVKFVSYTCVKPLLLLAKCILACSPGLLSMHFEYIFDKSEEFNVSAELLRFRWASSKAKVIYSCVTRASYKLKISLGRNLLV